MIVELPGAIFRLHKAGASGCWMGRRRAFRNSRDFVARPKAHEYTHVCRLCWPNRSQASEDDPSEGSLAPLNAKPAALPFSASEGEEGRRLGGEAQRRGENHVLATCSRHVR